MRTVLATVLLFVPSIAYAGTITPDGGNNDLASGYYDSDVCFCSAWYSDTRIATGANGVYAHYAGAITGGMVLLLHYGADHGYNVTVPNATSAGWREERVTATDGCGEYIEWTVQMRITLGGSFNCENNYPIYGGDCQAYGWAKVVLSGKASGNAEVKGTLTAEEGDETITVGAGPINISAPFSLDDSAGPFDGDDIVASASGASEPADVNDRIYLTGSVASRASTSDAAKKSEITVQIIEDNFDLSFVD